MALSLGLEMTHYYFACNCEKYITSHYWNVQVQDIHLVFLYWLLVVIFTVNTQQANGITSFSIC